MDAKPTATAGSSRRQPRMREGALVAACLQLLAYRGCFAWRQNQGAMTVESKGRPRHIRFAGADGISEESGDHFKADIDAAVSEAGRLASNHRVNGWENRYVDCTTTYDFKKSTRRTVRLDTGELVSEGPMTDDELKLAQTAIDFEAERERGAGATD